MARRRRRVRSPEIQPFDVDGVRAVATGTVLWAAAFVVLVFQRDALDDAGHTWWLWTCLAGVGLGLLGLEYCRKRRDRLAEERLRAEAELEEKPAYKPRRAKR